MAFNSSRVVSMKTSRVMISPCNVFNLSPRDMAGHTQTLQISLQMLYLKKRFETKKNTKKDRGYLRISLAISTWGTRKFGLKYELDPVDSSWFRDEIQLQVGMSWWNSVEMYVSSCFLIFVCSFVKNLEQRKHKNTVRWWNLSIYASMKNQILMMDWLILINWFWTPLWKDDHLSLMITCWQQKEPGTASVFFWMDKNLTLNQYWITVFLGK